MRVLMWFRSDLRATDNTALHHASMDAARDGAVLAAFIISPQEWAAHDLAPARLSLMLRTLKDLSTELASLNIPMLIETAKRAGDVPSAVLRIARMHQCDAVYFNREYEVDEARRDAQVQQILKTAGLRARSFTDQVVLAPDEVQKGGGGYYTVFTPFKRAWIARARERGSEVIATHPRPRHQRETGVAPSPVPPIENIGMQREFDLRGRPDDALWPAGHRAATARLTKFIQTRINRYKDARDFPGEEGTSTLSPYLAIGAISPRECFARALEASGQRTSYLPFDSGPAGAATWMSELIWREFYVHVLAGFPRVCMGRAFQPHTDALEWRSDDAALERWKEGRTGYPIVDAGMRQLAMTGWMHNRVRMITAMFLSKHLLLDWRLGERHFMRNLVDGFFASNNGGWQWAASTGTDAAPYFRIFNPYSQSRKFDPDGRYIRRWVPELASLSGDDIHEPHAAGLFGTSGAQGQEPDYPRPIVDHAEARARAIEAFKALRSET